MTLQCNQDSKHSLPNDDNLWQLLPQGFEKEAADTFDKLNPYHTDNFQVFHTNFASVFKKVAVSDDDSAWKVMAYGDYGNIEGEQEGLGRQEALSWLGYYRTHNCKAEPERRRGTSAQK